MGRIGLSVITITLLSQALLATSCPPKDIEGQQNDIIGTWTLTTNEVNYPAIKFNRDSSAMFSSRGDTIYWYKYFVYRQTIVLTDLYREQYFIKIHTLDKDSLVLEYMPGKKEIQRYYRKK